MFSFITDAQFSLPSAVYECSSCSASFPILNIGSFKILDNIVDIYSDSSFWFWFAFYWWLMNWTSYILFYEVNIGDTGSIPGLGRFPEEGNENSLQYSCLENPMDRGAWWATVYRVAQSRTWPKRLCISTSFKIVCSDTVSTIQKTLNKFLLSL